MGRWLTEIEYRTNKLLKLLGDKRVEGIRHLEDDTWQMLIEGGVTVKFTYGDVYEPTDTWVRL